MTPDNCPLVLNFIGDCLTEDEKASIKKTIRDDFAYDLGMVEKEQKRQFRIFLFTLIGLVVSGIALWMTQSFSEVPRELFFILFWFLGETILDYVFFTGYEIRRRRRVAGRLASVKVTFSDTFKKPDYSEQDVHNLYHELEKDVNRTIEDDEYL